jgi:hypothetical protein
MALDVCNNEGCIGCQDNPTFDLIQRFGIPQPTNGFPRMTKYGAVESGDIADVYDLLVLFDMN